MSANRLFCLLMVVALLSACAAPASPLPAPTAISTQPTVVPTHPATTTAPPPVASALATTALTQVPTLAAAFTLTSSLDGLTTLPHRVHWVAQPIGPRAQAVTRVAYFIDGQPAWVEKNAPYYYGSDGQYLVTSFLTPGEHNFTVRAFTADGLVASSTVTATVAAPPTPPNELANTAWTRMQTASDIAKSTSGQPGQPGRVGLTIDSIGWMFHDPAGGGLLFDVAYPAKGQVELRASIEKPPYPNNFGGAFCEEPDPDVLWSYTIGSGGKTLTLHPVDHEPCGDRLGAFEGTWTRQAK